MVKIYLRALRNFYRNAHRVLFKSKDFTGDLKGLDQGFLQHVIRVHIRAIRSPFDVLASWVGVVLVTFFYILAPLIFLLGFGLIGIVKSTGFALRRRKHKRMASDFKFTKGEEP